MDANASIKSLQEAYEDGFSDGSWEMFETITGMFYGKQCYFAEDSGVVYSRLTCSYLPTKDDAYKEFIDHYSRW